MMYLNEAKELLMRLSKEDNSANTYLDAFAPKEQAIILSSAKILLANVALKKGVNMQGACYDCKYRCNVPGDTHSSCSNKVAYVIGDEHGISKGWFLFPFNFDPIWLRYCDGFQAKEEKD